MTVKETLRERIEQMSDEEAAELLAQIEWQEQDFELLTPAEQAEADLGRAENDRGESLDGEALFRQLGL